MLSRRQQPAQPLWMAEGVQESGAKKAKLEREGDDDDEVEKR